MRQLNENEIANKRYLAEQLQGTVLIMELIAVLFAVIVVLLALFLRMIYMLIPLLLLVFGIVFLILVPVCVVYTIIRNEIKNSCTEEEFEDMDLPSWTGLFGLPPKMLLTIVISVVVIVLAVGCFGLLFSGGFGSNDNFDDVFEKDPNSWMDEEKDYVNDFFEWMGNN